MKRIFLIFAFICMVMAGANAQHYCIIDSKYILEKMQDYKDAQQKLQKELMKGMDMEQMKKMLGM